MSHNEDDIGEDIRTDAAWSLRGKNAVVTGSSSGIGRAVALRLAAAGANCVVHARENKAAAEEVAGEIAKLGVRSRVVLADLGDSHEQDRLLAQVRTFANRIDIWMNNAGADVLTGAAAEWSFEDKLRRLWQVDVAATVRLSRLVGQQMKQSGGGVILNMGWDQAERGMGGDSGEMFAAVKGAVIAFSRSLAKSLAPDVRVNCLAPGWIRTRWGQQASEYWQDRAKAESLLGRWGTPNDVARVAHFLVAPAAAFLTGQVIAVNGGFQNFSGQRDE